MELATPPCETRADPQINLLASQVGSAEKKQKKKPKGKKGQKEVTNGGGANKHVK